MRTVTFLFISSLLVPSVLSCLVTSDCPCGDIIDYAYNPKDMLYIKQSRCVQNITCLAHSLTVVYALMEDSEIPKPANVLQNSELFICQTNMTLNYADPAGPAIDIFSYFGMVCQNNT
ncbi:unnamed protein product [Caenorhabditis brenneri]